MENPVIIFGANPLGRMAKEIFESNGVVIYGFLDDDTKLHSKELDDAIILGSTDDDGFLKLIGKNVKLLWRWMTISSEKILSKCSRRSDIFSP